MRDFEQIDKLGEIQPIYESPDLLLHKTFIEKFDDQSDIYDPLEDLPSFTETILSVTTTPAPEDYLQVRVQPKFKRPSFSGEQTEIKLNEPKPNILTIPQKPKNYKIEDEYYELYYRYKFGTDEEALRELLKALRPVIEKGLRTFAGPSAKYLYGRAKLIVKHAIDIYDPQKAPLKSYIMLHLQRLLRETGKTGVIEASEQQRVEFKRLQDATKELEDSLGREPTDEELADYTGFSLKKIEKLRRALGGLPESQYQTMEVLSGKQLSPETMELIMDTVYIELDVLDKFIMEHYFGLRGKRQMTIEEIARSLNKSVGWVHKRIRFIEAKISEIAELV